MGTLNEIQEDIQHVMYVNNISQNAADAIFLAEVGLDLVHVAIAENEENKAELNELPKAMHSLGETLIFLCTFCSLKGWDLEAILLTTWETMKNKIGCES